MLDWVRAEVYASGPTTESQAGTQAEGDMLAWSGSALPFRAIG